MKKLNLSKIEGKLSREEMKNVVGGSGSIGYRFKCCFNGTTNCSSCVWWPNLLGIGLHCEAGAFLTIC